MSALLAFCFFACSAVSWLHVYQIVQDKKVSGVSLIPSFVFITTNVVEVIYFWRLLDWWSSAGAVSMVIANSAWLLLALSYRGGRSSNQVAVMAGAATGGSTEALQQVVLMSMRNDARHN